MKSFPELINEANEQINTVSVDDLKSLIDDPKLILVDVQTKEAVEESGMIKNAVHANRGFLEFYFDQRYKPSFTQKRLMEAGYLGKKTGRGFYNYTDESEKNISKNRELGKNIVLRILAMLVNEAADAYYLNIASKKDIDLAMTKGVNYPKGLLKWADEIGVDTIFKILETLYDKYCEDRYRPSPILRKMTKENIKFY